jgi:hypothetical protein
MRTGKLIKSQKWHIGQCILCFDRGAKAKRERIGKQDCIDILCRPAWAPAGGTRQVFAPPLPIKNKLQLKNKGIY